MFVVLYKLFIFDWLPNYIGTVILTKYSGDQIKKNEMGWACGMCTYLRKERCIQGFGG
jgi:hypothetical protein